MLREHGLSGRLAVFTLGGDGPATSYGANALALAGRGGTLVVDPFIAPAHARLLAEALARRGFPPVTAVVITHHHTDHALGAGLFARAGARVVAHARCAAAMAAQHPGLVAARRQDPALAALFEDAEPHVPAVRVEARLGLEVAPGEVVAEAVHLGHGHTPGDLVVRFPSEGVVAAGDLVFRGYHFNYEEADPAGAVRALEALAALPEGRVVPGHGPPGGREVLAEQARYHAEAARLVRAAPDREAARLALRAAFPGLLLPEAIETAIEAWEAR
jgi:cyclase